MTNNKYKILLVEDETNIVNFVTALLEANHYQVIYARSYTTAKLLYASYLPNLVILDLGLPDKDGSQMLFDIRQKEDTAPIIVLSARSDEKEKVRLLDMGANDYVTKPFGPDELLARIRSCLRQNRSCAKEGRLPGGSFECGGLCIRYDARQVFLDGKEIKLTQTEYNILALLSENCGKVMTYAAIINAIWHEGKNEASIKKLQVNMANIRKKFGARPGQDSYIANELGVGYRMNG